MPIPLSGIDPTHIERVDENIVLRERHAERAGHRNSSSAIAHRWNAVRRRDDAGKRVDIDDSAPALPSHVRNGGLRTSKVGHLQSIGMLENLFGLQGIDVAASPLAGIVHQDIDATPSLGDLINPRAHLTCVAYIDGRTDHGFGTEQLSFPANCANRFWVARANGKPYTLAREGLGDCGANAA